MPTSDSSTATDLAVLDTKLDYLTELVERYHSDLCAHFSDHEVRLRLIEKEVGVWANLKLLVTGAVSAIIGVFGGKNIP